MTESSKVNERNFYMLITISGNLNVDLKRI